MTDFYPSISTIVALFYFAFWFFKGVMPFSFWWLILIYAIDYIIATIVVINIEKASRRWR